jgi:hypothetical protein
MRTFEISNQKLAPNYYLIFATLIAFVIVKVASFLSFKYSPFGVGASVVLALVIYLSRNIHLKAPAPNALVIRGISTLFLLYTLMVFWNSPGAQSGITLTHIVNLGCILLLALSFKTEALIIPGLLLVVIQKQLVSTATDLRISTTDYMPLIEFGILLGLAPLIMGLIGSLKIGQRFTPSNIRSQDQYPILLIGVAIHCSNYFFSGVQKLLISDPIWFWVTENPTQMLMLAAYEMGSLPLTIFGDRFVDSIYSFLSTNILWLNALTLAIQIAPVIALRRVKWMIVLMVLFDITHIVIFLVSGIFFYKWIVLNALIVSALLILRHYSYDLRDYLLLVLGMVLAPSVFFVAFLGWHDTPSFNDEYFLAHTRGGVSLRVPTNYFLGSSVTYAQGRISAIKPGHFVTGALGVLDKAKNSDPRWSYSANCVTTKKQRSIEINFDRIESRVRRHHSYILRKLDTQGRFSYDLYPHHIWSLPWNYDEFERLNKKEIIGYSYVVESKCLSNKASIHDNSPILRTTRKYINVQH